MGMCAQSLNGVQLFATPCIVAHQASLSMEFSRQEYWSRLPLPIPGHLPYLGIKSTSLGSAAFGRQVLYHCVTWKPNVSVP